MRMAERGEQEESRWSGLLPRRRGAEARIRNRVKRWKELEKGVNVMDVRGEGALRRAMGI